MSTHLHGAEIRPTFDGNPMSWVTSDGLDGEGAFTAIDDAYYGAFSGDGLDNQWMKQYISEIRDTPERTKVNVYPNVQNPGNLWYHDHSMRVTRPNVQNGLSGMYIIRDPAN